jgi:hypothetical protein
MARRPKCVVCGEGFVANRRVRGRQRTCGGANCQRERHRRACSKWRKCNPDYDRERRARARVRRSVPSAPALQRDPLTEISWEAARDVMGVQAAVVTEETARILTTWARDAMFEQRAEITRKIATIAGAHARDAMGAATGPP